MFHLAVIQNAIRCAEFLLSRDINYSRRDLDHRAPLDYLRSCQENDQKWRRLTAQIGVQKLQIAADSQAAIKNATDPKMAEFDHLIATRNRDFLPQLVEFMEEKGMDINNTFKNGQTFLHRVIIYDCDPIPTAKTMLDNKADVNIRDNLGKTPADYMETLKLTESDKSRLEYILQKHG